MVPSSSRINKREERVEIPERRRKLEEKQGSEPADKGTMENVSSLSQNIFRYATIDCQVSDREENFKNRNTTDSSGVRWTHERHCLMPFSFDLIIQLSTLIRPLDINLNYQQIII